MRRLIVLIGTIALLLPSFKCYHESDTRHCFINFANLTEKTVMITQEYNYPDTDYNYYRTIDCYRVNSGEMLPGASGGLCYNDYESFFTNRKYKPNNDTLMIFVFDAEKVDADVSPQEAVIARYDVSLEDLQRNKWLLSYPPNENMAAIKMWPPYSSYPQ